MGKVFCLPVRANVPAAASHPPERDRVRAPNEPAHNVRGYAAFFKTSPARKKTRMATACLIALAVSGLILIVLWEIFS